MSERVEALLARLQKGLDKTTALFRALEPAQWEMTLYAEPYPWTVRGLLAHLVSAEDGLRGLAQDVAGGGRGAPEGFDYDAYNTAEQERLAAVSAGQLLADLVASRQETLAWAATLVEADLERTGYHPALGWVSLETLVTAIYGHQLMHARDLIQKIK